MADNYIWKYESDKQKFNKFKLDLSILLDHKLMHCARYMKSTGQMNL